jgi:hypothetical protein
MTDKPTPNPTADPRSNAAAKPARHPIEIAASQATEQDAA